jgi:alpha-tubulin suppressor-like RCC1 family protein
MTRQKMGFVRNFPIMLLAALAFSACAPDDTTPMAPLSLTDTAPAPTGTKTVMPSKTRASTRTSTPEPILKVESIVAGEGHSCALLGDGTVKCWGKNEFGQLGDGTTKNRENPVRVRGLEDVKALTAGWGHTCALLKEGAVMCWGYNRNGELGNGRSENSSLPVAVSRLSEGVDALAAGDDHTCAVLKEGLVMCWGFNETGQLGDGTEQSRNIPVQVRGLTGWIDGVAAGWGHTCALSGAGGVQCWGDNENGQLGGNASLKFSNSPMGVSGLTKDVKALTAKGGHTCALLDSGSVKCWGDNSYGQLGDGTADDRITPQTVAGLGDAVREVAAGWNHTCVTTEEGGMKCWGWNYYDQLGDRSKTTQVKPVSVAGLPGRVTAMGLGWRHSCVVVDSGLVICWGANEYGQGWNGWLVEHALPTATRAATPGGEKTSTKAATPQAADFYYQPMDSGGHHNCAVTKQGGVKCWGSNFLGQMGTGNSGSQSVPVDVIGLSGQAVGVAVGGGHSCALMRSGMVMCWGANFCGEIGDGTLTNRKIPVMVSGLSGTATAVAAGGRHTCAVVPAGVMCWGGNFDHQLGMAVWGSTYNLTPVLVKELPSGIRALSTISDHTCGLTREGGAVCWGLNESGQLGDGSNISRNEPVPVSGLGSGVISIAAGRSHSCAVTLDGTVKCWGENSYGQLGDGTHQPSFLPINVSQGEDKAVRVIAGFYHTCYQTGSGKVKCWGLNSEGQLGDGTFTTSVKPMEVLLPGKVVFLEAGDLHTCAKMADASFMCWGDNTYGQLGIATTASSNVPLLVWHE